MHGYGLTELEDKPREQVVTTKLNLVAQVADIGTHLPPWAEIVPNIILSFCSFKQEQATARNILRAIKSGTNVLHWDTVVKQVGCQDIRLRAQELAQRHLELES